MPELNAIVTQRHDLAPGLMIMRVAPLGWEFPAFKPGQFAVLGLPPEAPRSATSLPEVAGESAYLVDPTSPQAIAEGLIRLAGEPGLRQTLAAKGLANARRFSWEETARQTLDVFELAAGSQRGSAPLESPPGGMIPPGPPRRGWRFSRTSSVLSSLFPTKKGDS